ncbi:MAG: 3-phosphoshikimate 1-carboxyvinyltransferase [Bacteroidales bacterium]|jgi:3-phosphoshikimate 1-carboxyvinyltransferase
MQEFKVPSSKSISNRLLIIKYLSQSKEEIHNISTADDTSLMKELLTQIEESPNDIFFCHNAGTVTRFLISLLALKKGIWRIDGDINMRKRPIKPLVDILKELGAEISSIKENDKLPIKIAGETLIGGKTINIDSSLSSQFISSILLISPYIKEGLKIEMKEEIVSKPYIDMTISLIKLFGAIIKKQNNKITVSYSPYTFKEAFVESDWSSTCFAYEKLSILKQGKIFINNLYHDSLQPDSIAEEYFSLLGIETKFKNNGVVLSYNYELISPEKELEFDIKSSPDIFPPLVIASLFSEKKVIFKGIKSLEHKESNRIKSMLQGLQKIGANAYLEDNKFIINGFSKQVDKKIIIKTYDDHRIAMAFAIASLKLPNIKIDNKDCVSKSFPMFWENL